MTKRELSQLYYLNREIGQEKRRLGELEAAAQNISPKITGLPHVGGISDKTAIAAEIADCKAIIEGKIKASIAEYNRLNRYIAGVDDCLIRQILSLRYINGFSWAAVALHIGGGNTADGVRKAHDRWLLRSSVLSASKW
ncbi:hypothetical protein [Bittarella massiliensis (ex Durand et al. 2017)]|uniref:hypothetical protein n=1 Tax=Bittarella massiliensis (ex Durand et al. 2017) TaxID=1720313 RepID=UPI00073ED176|nr:hypothetical protein [Bittarella massiliensis (ex Durand et al. 2017)]